MCLSLSASAECSYTAWCGYNLLQTQCPLVWIFSRVKKNPETKWVFHPSRSEDRVSTSFGLGSTAYLKINRGLGKYLNQCIQQLLQRVEVMLHVWVKAASTNVFHTYFLFFFFFNRKMVYFMKLNSIFFIELFFMQWFYLKSKWVQKGFKIQKL